jgi:serine/threonine-protein kinase RsbW
MPADGDEPALHLVIPSDPMAVRDGLRALFDTLLLRSLPEDERGTAEIVLAEALNNVVEHAYANSPGTIELTVTLNGGGLVCRIVDQGVPLPRGVPPEGMPPAPDLLPEGGFGWHLIRTLSRDLAYDRIGNMNQLSFRLERGAL